MKITDGDDENEQSSEDEIGPSQPIPLLEKMLDMSPNTLTSYMHEVKIAKHRALSNNEDDFEKIINVVQLTDRRNTARSYLNSKRSETSNEVWNAQSSYQNGIQTPCSTNLRSAKYSNTNASPK